MPISQKIDVYSSECHHYPVKHYGIYHLNFPALLGPRNTYVYVTVFNLLVSFRGEKNRFYKNAQSIYPVVETKQIYTHTSTKNDGVFYVD